MNRNTLIILLVLFFPFTLSADPEALLENTYLEDLSKSKPKRSTQSKYALYLWREKRWDQADAQYAKLSTMRPEEANEIARIRELISQKISLDSESGEKALIALRDKRVSQLKTSGLTQQLERQKSLLDEHYKRFGIEKSEQEAKIKKEKVEALAKQYEFDSADWGKSAAIHSEEYQRLSYIILELSSYRKKEEALAVSKELLEKFPQTPEAHMTYARMLSGAHYYKEAVNVLANASLKFPRRADIKVLRDIYEKASKMPAGPERAMVLLEELKTDELISLYRRKDWGVQ